MTAYNRPMRYGISAGAIVLRQEKLLLVHHKQKGEYDFWVPPGGRLEGEESIQQCAEREVLEETGLCVQPGRLLYIQEFVQPDYHFVKFFLLCRDLGGSITLENKPSGEDFLIEARFFGKQELQKVSVFPKDLRQQFWDELAAGFLETRYLGLEHIPADA
jgi:8-oxo-dGTP diphosphatase